MTRVGEYRPAYKALREKVDGLPDLGGAARRDTILDALAAWEDEPSNVSSLETTDSADANHMFGINGAHVVRSCFELILVRAGTDITADVGSSGKGSTLNELIGALTARAGAAARAEWMERHADLISDLEDLVQTQVERSTGAQADRINGYLRTLVPNASVSFAPRLAPVMPKTEASVTTTVTIDKTKTDLSRQGHGVQRAIMIAMFQALVPDADYAASTHSPKEGESEEDAAARLQELLDDLPALAVCVEEPEIYQHPIRARAFARVLTELARSPRAQVLVATHSPYFVRPPQFASLRRLTMKNGVSTVEATSTDEVAAAAGLEPDDVRRIVDKRLPTTFSEGFFADAVVLVEGDTDQLILEAIAEKMGKPLDQFGISVLELSGKDAIGIPYAIFAALNTPVYPVIDGDALGAERKHGSGTLKEASARASHEKSTNKILAWLPAGAVAIEGELPYSFGDETVVSTRYTIWKDDIEYELSKWPTFVRALESENGELWNKKASDYKSAAIDAQLEDMPQSLRACVDAIIGFHRDHFKVSEPLDPTVSIA